MDDILRTSTEVPEALDKGSIVIGGIEARGVVNAIRIIRESFYNQETPHRSPDYLVKNILEGCEGYQELY